MDLLYIEVLVRTESIDLQFGKLEVFEGQPKFHLIFQQFLSLSNIYLVLENWRYIFILKKTLSCWNLQTNASQTYWDTEFF